MNFRARFGLRIGFARSLRNVVEGVGLDLKIPLGNLGALDEAFPRDERGDVELELGTTYSEGAFRTGAC